MWKELRPAIIIFLVLSLITGIVYPALVTGIAQGLFPNRANGSLLVRGGKAIGSRLIGQAFSDPRYFWGRPSDTSPIPYDATASGGSNLGPTNPALIDAVKSRIATLRAADPGNDLPIPVDLVTASGSGLDPDISPAAALYQVPRVARARGLDPASVARLVRAHVTSRQFGLLGEPRVNVLELNLALDALRK
ncbi:MAG: potassium-transporting ATPase subunit KdpC [Betaproteobacteria bacterium]|nr:potassium-transporting ATPase subunit KdpC [Betaproteobacteria bacterium]